MVVKMIKFLFKVTYLKIVFQLLILYFIFCHFLESTTLRNFLVNSFATFLPISAYAQQIEKKKSFFVMKSYKTKKGDTLSDIARIYNLPKNILADLNKNKFFFIDYDVPLKEEIFLNVPEKPLSQEEYEKIKKHFYIEQNLKKEKDTISVQKNQSDNLEHVINRLKNIYIENLLDKNSGWFNEYGILKFQTEFSKNFNLKFLKMDAFFPIFDKEKNLFFFQGTLHKSETKSQFSIGLGARYILPSYIIGTSVFLDNDMLQGFKRLSLGYEYWLNYFHFNANGYFSIPGWQNEKFVNRGSILEDEKIYKIKVANGFDMQIEAYLPAYPNLGGTARFEQYFGENIALDHGNFYQKNPKIITLGLNYMPIPLVNFYLNYKTYSEKQNINFGAEFIYRFNSSFKNQLNHNFVDALRRIPGSRYDFVKRNNNIILDYQKEVFRLDENIEIQGFSGEEKKLVNHFEFSENWFIKKWDNPSNIILSDECRKIDNLNSCFIKLPSYREDEQSSNEYFLNLIFGNLSTREEKESMIKISVLSAKDDFQVQKNISGKQSTQHDVIKEIKNVKNWSDIKWILPDKFFERKGFLSPECQTVSQLKSCKITLPLYDTQNLDYSLKLKIRNKNDNKEYEWPIKINICTPENGDVIARLSSEKKEVSYGEKIKIFLYLEKVNGPPVDISPDNLNTEILFRISNQEKKFLPVSKEKEGTYSVEFVAGNNSSIFQLEVLYQKKFIAVMDINVCDFSLKIDPEKSFLKANTIEYVGQDAKITLYLKNSKGEVIKGAEKRIKLRLSSQENDREEIFHFIEEKEGVYQTFINVNEAGRYSAVILGQIYKEDKEWSSLNLLYVIFDFVYK